MSTVNVNVKYGHPVAGIVLGIASMGVSLLLTLLFGVVAGAIAAGLGIFATFLGFSAHKHGNRGIGAVVSGVLAIILAVTMTFTSVNIMKTLKETAQVSGVAPHFAQYMDNPYLGIASVAANAANDTSIKDPVQTVSKELDALKEYTAKAEKHGTKKAPVVEKAPVEEKAPVVG